MKIAVTGGTGFVGRNLAARLLEAGHEVILLARGKDAGARDLMARPDVAFARTDLQDETVLRQTFAGCAAVVHLAGINNESNGQSFADAHVGATRNVVAAARMAGVSRIVLLSFLRARPDCGSPYHESKWSAEELVRRSGLQFTVFKAGVIYGRGDHMLDHLSRAFCTFPIFAFVGYRDRGVRPVTVEDATKLLEAAVVGDRLSGQTIAVVGPERLGLRDAVRRVARVCGRNPLMFPLPVWMHRIIAWGSERTMISPMASTAQIRMLAEGVVEPSPETMLPPDDLAPRIPFSIEQIRKGIPAENPYGWRDLKWCGHLGRRNPRPRHAAFLLLP